MAKAPHFRIVLSDTLASPPKMFAALVPVRGKPGTYEVAEIGPKSEIVAYVNAYNAGNGNFASMVPYRKVMRQVERCYADLRAAVQGKRCLVGAH